MLPSTGRVKLNRSVLKVNGNNGLPSVPRRRRPFKVLYSPTGETHGDPNRIRNTLECSSQNSEVKTKDDSVLGNTESSVLKSENHNFPPYLGTEKGHLASETAVGKTTAVPADSGELRSPPLTGCEGMELSKRNYFKYTGNNFEVEVDGPYTRSKYVQAKVGGPHTRSKSATRRNGVIAGHKKELCCRLQFAVSFGSGGSNKLTDTTNTFNQAISKGENSRHVSYYIKSDLSVKSRVRACGAAVNARDVAAGKAPATLAKKAGKSVLRRTRSIERKRNVSCLESDKAVEEQSPAQSRKITNISANNRVSSALKLAQGREGKFEVENLRSVTSATSAGTVRRGAESTEGDAGHAVKGAFSLLNGISNIDRSPIVTRHRPKPPVSSPSCPQRSVRRVVKTLCCALCGEFKYTPPKRRRLTRVEPVGVRVTGRCRASVLSRVVGLEQPKVRVKTRKNCTSTIKAPKKLVIWIGRYPKVKLCDVAQVCDVSVGGFSCLLPAQLLTSKVVHCFKWDYRREVSLLGPNCHSGGSHGSEMTRERPSRKKSHHCSQCGKSGQLLTLTEIHQCMHTGEHGLTESNRSASLTASECGMSEASTNGFACLSLGKQQVSRGSSGAGTHDRSILEDSGTPSDDVETGKPVAKRMRLLHYVSVDITPKQSSPSETELDPGIAMASLEDSGTWSEMPCDVPPHLHTSHVCRSHSNATDTPVRSHHSVTQDGGWRGGPGGGDKSLESPANGTLSTWSVENEVGGDPPSDSNTEDQDLFSCRRVVAYMKRLHLSCARTYLSWPFPKPDSAQSLSVTSSVLNANGTLTPPAESESSTVGCVNGALVNGNGDSLVRAERTRVLPSHCTLSEYTPQTSYQVYAHRNGMKRDGKEGEGNMMEEKDMSNGIGGEADESVTQFSLSPDTSSKVYPSRPLCNKKPQSQLRTRGLHRNKASTSPPPKAPISTLLTPPQNHSETDTALSVSSSLSQTDTDTVSCLSPPKTDFVSTFPPPKVIGGSETDTPHFSTPSPDPASTPSPIGLGSDIDTATAFLLFSSASQNIETSPPPSSPTPSSPRRKDEGVAMFNATSSPSAVDSETDTSHSAESSPLPPDFCLSAESSFLSSSSSLLPQEKREGVEVQRRGEGEKGEGALSGDERKDELEVLVLPGSEYSSPKKQEQQRPEQKSTQAGSSLSKPKEGEAVVATISSLTPGILGGQTPILCITRLMLQTQSYSEEDDDCVDQKEKLSSAVSVGTQAQATSTDDEDGTCGEEGQSQSSGDGRLEPVKTQPCTDDVNHHNQSTSCIKVTSENQTAGTPSSSGSPTQHQEVEVRAGSKVKLASEPKADLLDEFTAYEQDILLVDVLLDDPELFGSLPQNRDPMRGSTRGCRAPRARTTIGAGRALLLTGAGPSWATEKSSTTGTDGPPGSKTDQRRIIHFKDVESAGRSWRPVASSNPKPALVHSNSWAPTVHALHPDQGGTDYNYSPMKAEIPERAQAIQSLNSFKSTLPYLMTGDSWCNGHTTSYKDPAAADTGPQRQFDSYCKYYFSMSDCFHKTCWFLHVPKRGDEKFCVETVLRFVRSSNPVCLQRAVSVFTSYYQSSPPGVYHTPLVLNSLLAALLKAGFLSDIITVLHVSTAHNILPSPAFLLALFDYVGEKDQSVLPELIQLTSKMVDAGLGLNVDQCERVLHMFLQSPQYHPTDSPGNYTTKPGNHRSMNTEAPTPEALSLAHALVELCSQQEDWGRLGVVFRSICHSHRSLVELQHFSGCVAIALLEGDKDRLALPFASFSETVYQETEDWEAGLIKTFLGRIGVSLMFRYHKTQQWAKGRRLVDVLSRLKVNYSTLKGLFGNEDGASRCRLITIATELFLRSDSVEGALNTLRDNEWFLSSCVWPCSVEDVAERTTVLVRLAEKTSHRDTLEVLTNLPGLKEPADLADISIYGCLFNDHLKSCVDRQTVTVASDTLGFMLSKSLAVDPLLLHTLLHKLGKQNIWLRARALFKQALCLGYYPGVKSVPGSLALTVPCSLGEMEIALAFEMVLTLNATTILNTTDTPQSIIVTLKRTGDSESEYLAAGSRLLSAAIVPNPKLTVHYTAVNSCQEQLFTVDSHTARRWLRHNHTWANEVWTHS
uniref:Protein TOPAZ1 n=1 Tax=Hucho hucho TaxID=62062 RepID=A0A4W5N8A7_9TELE